jgi:phosphate acyltransferase
LAGRNSPAVEPGRDEPGQAEPGRDGRTIVVAVDCNGADLGPAEVAAGAALAARAGVRSILFGPAGELAGAVRDAPAGMIEVVDAPVSIAKSPDPARAVRREREASIVQTATAVAHDRAQALVCAGGTGAALAAGLFNIKRTRGVHRPALALPIPMPQPSRPVTLLDVGANTQARSEHLEQFAFMGAALSSIVLGIERPRVGLLSNGEEAERGSGLVVETYARLAALGARRGLNDRTAHDDGPRDRVVHDGSFEFVGNVEGGDLVEGVADVIVTDGFTGNVALKVMEGVSQRMLGAIRDVAMSSAKGKLGGMLLRPGLREFRDEIDPEGQGGAYLLGLRALGVVPHGSFSRRGFEQAILRAQRGAQEDLVGRTHGALAWAEALRTPPMSSGETPGEVAGDAVGDAAGDAAGDDSRRGPASASSASLPDDEP